MVVLLTIIHVLCCFFLIGVVLLQSGKAADLAGAFGGMGSQTAFGPRGAATLLAKVTTVAAAVFMLTSLSLSVLATKRGSTLGGSSVLEKTTQNAPQKKEDSKSGQPKSAPINIQTPAGSTTVNVPLTPETPAQAPQAPAKK
ncbi:MAG: preprotein translocase subunit SecG [Bryobacteraceae bacterium]|nr:preprotein translocase subunit SecG [Bryobacteraceae bacterium]MDW8380193.1 preprotein translocase subunit SecG [Bryobacterales bacterium]